MKQYLFLCLLFFLFSCTKEVKLDLQFEPKNVLTGGIEHGKTASIKIQQTLSVTDNSEYPNIDNALVYLENASGFKEQLRSEGNGVYQGQNIIGEDGKYEITVNIDGNEYEGETTMPIDNIEVKKFDYEVVSEDSNGNLLVTFDIQMNKKTSNAVFERIRYYYNSSEFYFSEFQYFSHNDVQPDSIQTSIPLNNIWRSGDSLTMEVIQMEEWLSNYFLEARNVDDVNTISVVRVSPIGELENNFDGDLLGYFGAIRKDVYKLYID